MQACLLPKAQPVHHRLLFAATAAAAAEKPPTQEPSHVSAQALKGRPQRAAPATRQEVNVLTKPNLQQCKEISNRVFVSQCVACPVCYKRQEVNVLAKLNLQQCKETSICLNCVRRWNQM
jgi:hypothetical protein